MTKGVSVREVIAGELFWPFEGVYGDPSAMADDYAARLVSEIHKAGFVIVSREPSEKMTLASLKALGEITRPYPAKYDEGMMIDPGMDADFAEEVNAEQRKYHADIYRAMLTAAQGEG